MNAIDDHLLKGDQVPHDWNIDGIRPLELLLDYASYAGRAVIATSDHGHILDRDTEARVIAGAKERWRPDNGDAADDEVEISGPRTLSGDGSVLMPWAEQLRYSSGRRNGYHGGATPQEVLIPLDVLVTGETPNGWTAAPRRKPPWWSLRSNDAKSSTRVQTGAKPPKKAAQASLFEPAPQHADWIAELLDCDQLERQRKQAGARTVAPEHLRSLLHALDSAGHPLNHMELADAMHYPLARLRGLLASVERLLNVEGYAVIEDDGMKVSLDRELATTQFGLEA